MNTATNNKFYIETYGCQMNRSDSTSIANTFLKHAFENVESAEEANIIIINTCSVREHAENRVFGRINKLVWLRKTNKLNYKIVVTGCMARSSAEKLSSLGVDYVFDVYEQNNIYTYFLNDENSRNEEVSIDSRFGYNYEFKSCYVDETFPYKAYLPITHGCNNFCTYCIVPYTRGPIVSRSSDDIIFELKNLIDSGAKEITLLGQNVNSYGLDKNDINFVDLLYKIDKYASGKCWIRFLTSHPKDFSKELAEAILGLDSICSSLHLPLQSGSNRMLSLMNRKYTKEQYLEKVAYLRDIDNMFALSTDMIVGFADETDSEFEETLEMLKTIKYEDAFLYKYSERKGTSAHKKSIGYNKEKGQERLSTMIDFQRAIARETLSKLVGKKLSVMVKSIAKDKKHYQCDSYESRIVLLDIDKNEKYAPGDILDVSIYDIINHNLIAKKA